MINTIPLVNNNKPSNDFLLNFSFNNTKDKNIVNKISAENLQKLINETNIKDKNIIKIIDDVIAMIETK